MNDTPITYHASRRTFLATLVRARWLVLIVSLIIILLPVPYVLSNWTPVGDEPHYLLAAYSLVHDGDLDLANNYAQGDYRAFYDLPIDPHVRIGADGRLYLSHDIGLPILIAPAYAFGGRAAVIIFLAIIAALVAVNVYWLAYEVTGHPVAAMLTWLILLLTPILSVYAYLVYPEMIGALIVIWTTRRLFKIDASRVTRHSSLITQSAIVALALAVLPWLSARFIPIAVFLLAWKIRRDRSNRKQILISIGVMIGSLIGYFALNAWLSGGAASAIDFDTGLIAIGFQGISIERILRGLIGWWLDQQRGVLIYSPVDIIALIGLPWLWRRLRWSGIALLAPLLVAYLSAVAWGGFWVGWEISARYLVIGLPLLAAPLALALVHIRRVAFRGLVIVTFAIALINSVVLIKSPGLWGYRESIVLFYDRYTSIDLWRWLPAMSAGAAIDPTVGAIDAAEVVSDNNRSAWHTPIGSGGVVIQTSSLTDVTIGIYELHFDARAENIPAVDAPLLSIDVFSAEGVSLKHQLLSGADFAADGSYRSFSVAFDQPFYNKWT
ncbi:MAG TPA: hypothetical protein VFF70_07290, partial [Anaerolineae bacterium]|nr:hypothetical protein [Anaerolineae bacterium]